MTTNELITALQRLKVESGSIVCLGCGYEHNCGIHGGAIAGNRLDLYFDSHEDALRWGVREKIVRWAG
jgi:3D (Asp-Asp-Asp) domain-containing protein